MESEKDEMDVLAYATSDVEPITEDDERAHLKQVYDAVKAEYKALRIQRNLSESTGNAESVNNLTTAIGKNYKLRKEVVKELLVLGVDVKDPFVSK
jgi:hypothetical protein